MDFQSFAGVRGPQDPRQGVGQSSHDFDCDFFFRRVFTKKDFFTPFVKKSSHQPWLWDRFAKGAKRSREHGPNKLTAEGGFTIANHSP
ncbi:MAG: hypothetical protein HQL86_01235 [Magnetococcales bacterium]|nr:hypothetical protein [Magnetococcales bacterium]